MFLKSEPVALTISEKINTLKYIEIKNFSYLEDIKKVKVQFTIWEKVCATYIIHKEYIIVHNSSILCEKTTLLYKYTLK